MKANVSVQSDSRSAVEESPVNFFGYIANLNLLFISKHLGCIFVRQMDYLEIYLEDKPVVPITKAINARGLGVGIDI